MRRKVEAYRTAITTTEFRVYNHELRKLLKLPVRKGKFVSAKFDSQRLEIVFEDSKHKSINLN